MSKVKSVRQDNSNSSSLLNVIFCNIPAAFRVAEANGVGTARVLPLSKAS
ncbi:hypothetical protein AFFFEF_00321 [Methylorubrum extorquens]